MSGQLDGSNDLVTWSCQLHDTVTNVSGFGDCLESQSIDALGNIAKSLTDGAGRTLRSLDQLGNVTTFTYDAGGNQLSVRDPNSVGQDVVYDALGRAGLTTDTSSDTTNSTYDKAGNRLTATDGSEAEDIIFRLIAAWQNNYGRGCHPTNPNDPGYHRDPVGGLFRWDWSTILDEALRGGNYQCFNAMEWGADEPGGYVHWFTPVFCGTKPDKKCTVIFDDGFFTGTTANGPDEYMKNYPTWTYLNPKNCYDRADCPHVPIGF